MVKLSYVLAAFSGYSKVIRSNGWRVVIIMCSVAVSAFNRLLPVELCMAAGAGSVVSSSDTLNKSHFNYIYIYVTALGQITS